MNYLPTSMMRGILMLTFLGTAGTRGCTQTQPQTQPQTQQPKTQFNIAIFLYDGVELLDFAGPGEAFSATPDFNVYTVSVDGKSLVSQGFVTIQPQYSIGNAPNPDIVVFPGGGVDEAAKNKNITDWANALVAKGTTAMSVCNGAYILANTGLLNGLTVTTHHGAIEGLRKLLPQSTVLDNAKYVDNGNIITAAGVSSGIECALHMIARIKGTDIAKAVAHYMEYNKWQPEEGLSLYRNWYIEKWRQGSGNQALSASESQAPPAARIPYEGEIRNLAEEYIDKGNYAQSVRIMQQAIIWYPKSSSCHNMLGSAYSKAGNRPDAVAAYKRSLELDPNDKEASTFLSQPQNK